MSDQGVRHQLFVEPRLAWPLAIARIELGLTVFAWTATLLVDVSMLAGEGAGVPPEFADTTFAWLPHDSTAVMVMALLVLLAASVAVTIGFRPTVFLVVIFVLLVAVQRRAPQLLNSGDIIIRNLALLLALCPTGAAASFDRARRIGRDGWFTSAAVAPWGLRLVQLQVMVVYLFAFWSKSGDTWRDGTAVSTALRLVDLQRFGQLDMLVSSVPVVAALTWGTLAAELALATLLWVKRLRPALIVVGLALHLSIDATMLVGFFGFAMFAGLMTFLDADAVDRRVRAWREQRGESGSHGEADADLGAAAG